MSKGTLVIVATPIGNMGDLTIRAIEMLQAANIIYAEDTRVTAGLLARYQLKTPLRSYREATDRARLDATVAEVCSHLEQGELVAYVSDAGTPGISDPGDYLVARVIERGFRVVPIPGASALTAILSVAGLGVQHPLFEGFLPHKKGRQTRLTTLRKALLSDLTDGVVFYESPHRIQKLLSELVEWGEVRLCVGRELTKQFEEIIRGTPTEVSTHLAAMPAIKGEFVLIVTNG